MLFQSKRKSLSKRLWRARMPPAATNPYVILDTVCQNIDTDEGGGSVFRDCCPTMATTIDSCHSNGGGSSSSSTVEQEDPRRYKMFLKLVEKLKDKQLETLKTAVDVECGRLAGNSNATVCVKTDCVLVRRGELDIEPHVIACQIWRWADLWSSTELKRIPICSSERDPIYVCCNPAHWSRVVETETPPPSYNSIAMERLKEENPQQDFSLGNVQRYPGSLTTDGEGPIGWCQLAYWELSERVGDKFPVRDSTFNIYSEQLVHGDGLCLNKLAKDRRTQPNESVLRTRRKIGLGITLSREPDGVWLYNRSVVPVFVHSPTLNDIDSKQLNVCRVPPGHCLRAFDPYRASEQYQHQQLWPGNTLAGGIQLGPVDIYSLRISFAKGWGPNYSRQHIASCPCWLEVMLSPCR